MGFVTYLLNAGAWLAVLIDGPKGTHTVEIFAIAGRIWLAAYFITGAIEIAFSIWEYFEKKRFDRLDTKSKVMYRGFRPK